MTLGKEELKHIFEEEKEIEAECQFCGKKYKFTENDFEDILNVVTTLRGKLKNSIYLSLG